MNRTVLMRVAALAMVGLALAGCSKKESPTEPAPVPTATPVAGYTVKAEVTISPVAVGQPIAHKLTIGYAMDNENNGEGVLVDMSSQGNAWSYTVSHKVLDGAVAIVSISNSIDDYIFDGHSWISDAAANTHVRVVITRDGVALQTVEYNLPRSLSGVDSFRQVRADI